MKKKSEYQPISAWKPQINIGRVEMGHVLEVSAFIFFRIAPQDINY